MESGKVVLDGDDMRRTLVRIAHEIVEKNATGDGTPGLAIVGIHRRGAILARRLHDLLSDLLEREVAAPSSRSSTPATSTSRSTITTVVPSTGKSRWLAWTIGCSVR